MAPPSSRSVFAFLLCAVALLGCLFAARALLGTERSLAFVLFALAALPWGVALLLVPKLPDRSLIGAAILFTAFAARAPFLFHEPVGSDDVYRYLWDGRVARAGINPYRFAPDAEELRPHRDELVWPKINHPTIPTIYPPLAQLTFLLASTLAVWKALVLLADLGVGLLLAVCLRRRGRDWRLAIAWLFCPLVVLELALDAHMDVLGILPLLGALVAVAARSGSVPVPAAAQTRAAILVALSSAAKLLGVVAIVPLVAERRRALVPFALTFALVCLPFLSPGSRMLSGADVYARKWVAAPGAYALLYEGIHRGVGLFFEPQRPVWTQASPAIARLVTGETGRSEIFSDELASALARLVALALFVTALALAAIRRVSLEETSTLGISLFLLFTPALLPWYALWIVPFLVLPGAASRPLAAAGLFAFVAFVPLLHLGGPNTAPPTWAALVTHGTCWSLIAASVLRRGRV